MLAGGVGEGVTQAAQAVIGLAEPRERVLSGPEALADHVAEVVVDHPLLRLHDVRETGDTFGLGGRRLDEQDLRAGRDGVRVLDVQRGLFGPAVHRGVAGAELWQLAVAEDVQRRVREAPLLIEDLQVMADGRGPERVDDDDRPVLAGDARAVERAQVVGDAVLNRAVAAELDRGKALRGAERVRGAEPDDRRPGDGRDGRRSACGRPEGRRAGDGGGGGEVPGTRGGWCRTGRRGGSGGGGSGRGGSGRDASGRQGQRRRESGQPDEPLAPGGRPGSPRLRQAFGPHDVAWREPARARQHAVPSQQGTPSPRHSTTHRLIPARIRALRNASGPCLEPSFAKDSYIVFEFI